MSAMNVNVYPPRHQTYSGGTNVKQITLLHGTTVLTLLRTKGQEFRDGDNQFSQHMPLC